MALPKLSQPIFTLTLPSSGRKVRYRQFTVREEKILLVAQTSGEKSDMINAFKQLITNCCLDEIDVDNMPAFDVEYFFIHLRAKSVSNVIKLEVTENGKKNSVEINLDKVEVTKPTVKNKMILDEKSSVGVVLRYPTFAMLERMMEMKENDPESSLELFKMIIESIFDAETVYPVADVPQQELEDFILSMNNAQVAMVQKFLEDMPYVYIDVEYTIDGEKKTQRVRGIDSFFG